MMPAGDDPYGVIDPGVIGVTGDRITYVGTDSVMADQVWSAGGRWVTPGLIDCHTHLVFAGSRSSEFARRLAGDSYADIAAAGGGIMSTVRATRRASDEELLDSAVRRLRWLVATGATTVEVKSGYGLDLDTEMRMLRIGRRLGRLAPVEVVTTLLGAHTVPAEHRADRDAYVALVCEEMIPAAVAAGLADAVDVFSETVGFTPAETERVLGAAAAAGLPIKAHTGQLSDDGSAELAARMGAMSLDHLEYVGPAAIGAMAESGTVAVLLPGASYMLGEEQRPPVAELRAAGVPLALSTDLNPGTSPVGSLPLICSLAAHRFGMTPAECVAGVTVNAAAALGLDDRGTIEPDRRADLAVWDIDEPGDLAYWVGADVCRATIVGGVVTEREENRWR